MSKAFRFHQHGGPEVMHFEDVELGDPGPGQVRVRIEGCGVCASNIPPWEGREWFTYPMPPGQLGHEAWGRVDANSGRAPLMRRAHSVRSACAHHCRTLSAFDPGAAAHLIPRAAR